MTPPHIGITADSVDRTMSGPPRCHEASLTERDGSIRSLPELGSSGATVVHSFGVVAVIVPPSRPREQT
jgi:hypothetical protein